MATARTARSKNGGRVTGSEMRDDIAAVRDDIEHLLSDLRRLTRQEVSDGVDSAAHAVKGAAAESTDRLRTFVQENPLGACAAAAVVGAVIATLARMR